MNVARLLYPVRTLGPGNRLGIWMCGCHRRCRGCSNPELWKEREEYEISVGSLAEVTRRLAEENEIDGFTVTGGEPLNQAEELSAFLEELLRNPDDPGMRCVRKAAVVVDGPYQEEKNSGNRMVGSGNQRVFVVNPDYADRYREYLSDGTPEIQNFTGRNSLYSIGIHRSSFADDMIHFLNSERGQAGHE